MDELNKVLLALYAASREVPLDQFQEAALSLLKSAVHFDSAIWGSGLLTRSGLSYHSLHLHNEPQDLAVQYEEVKHQDDAVLQLWTDAPSTTRRFHAPLLFQARDKAGIRAYAARLGHQNYIVSSERSLDTGLAHWIALYRVKRENQYSETERLLVAQLAPHLREALRINCVLHMERSYAGRDGYCTAIADLKGFLHHADASFADMIHAEWPHWNGGSLPDELIQSLTRTSHGYTGESLVLRCTWVKSLMFLKTRAKRAADSLTEREQAIALQVKQGLSHKEIARVLGVAPATVRNHVQNIHRKLGAHTNAEVAGHLLLD